MISPAALPGTVFANNFFGERVRSGGDFRRTLQLQLIIIVTTTTVEQRTAYNRSYLRAFQFFSQATVDSANRVVFAVILFWLRYGMPLYFLYKCLYVCSYRLSALKHTATYQQCRTRPIVNRPQLQQQRGLQLQRK